MRLKTALLPLAAAVALPLNGQALTLVEGVELFGQFHGSVDLLDNDAHGADHELGTSSNSSLIGLRGQHALNDRVTLVWQAEGTLDFTQDKDFKFDRDNFLGAQGRWGLFRAGQFDSPLKVLRNRTDLFGNQLGDARNVTHFRGHDRRLRNALAWRSPQWHGLVLDLQYSTDSNSDTNQNESDSVLSSSVTWQNDQVWLALAYDHDRALDEQAVRLATSIAVTPTLRLNALVQTTDSDLAGRDDTTSWGLGARFQLSERLALKGQYYQLQVDNADDDRYRQVAVGLDYQYARPLLLYVNVAQGDAEGATLGRTPYQVARTNTTSGNGERPNGVSVGAVYRF